MLKHLPPRSLEALLDIFNDMWKTGKFPKSWELATIIPVPKPGKDHTEPTNYRPIALTSCLCKTLEKMINTRLVWYLEFNNLFSPVQSGFRSERSTNNNLIRLETFIRDAFIKKEHEVAVFFDLEKAYDTTWRYGILRDLHELGLKGRLPTFIESFLAEHTIQVRVGSTLSIQYNTIQYKFINRFRPLAHNNIWIQTYINVLVHSNSMNYKVNGVGFGLKSLNSLCVSPWHNTGTRKVYSVFVHYCH